MQGTVLGPGDILVNKTHIAPALLKLIFLMGEIKKKKQVIN